MELILEVISGLAVLAFVFYPSVGLILMLVAGVVGELVKYITHGDVNRDMADLFIQKYAGWTDHLPPQWNEPLFLWVICSLFGAVVGSLWALSEKDGLADFPLAVYNVGVDISPVLGVIVLAVGSVMLARLLYGMGKKVRQISQQLTTHANDTTIHNSKGGDE